MASITISELYEKAPATKTTDEDLLMIMQGGKTKSVKLSDVTVGAASNAAASETATLAKQAQNADNADKALSAHDADYAEKFGTSKNHPAIGSKSIPVYIDEDGVVRACSIAAITGCPFPIDAVYPQYPGRKAPMELWPDTTWEPLDYGGAFFRSLGGNADDFEKTAAVVAVNDAVLTFEEGHGIGVASILYSPELNESHIVTAVSGNSVTIDNAFRSPEVKSVIVGQHDQFQGHVHSYQGTDQSTCYGHNETKQRYQIEKTTSGPISDGRNGVPRVGKETRSVNFTKIIWLRTA